MIEDMDLRVQNVQGQPVTYARRGMGASNIDVTLSRSLGPGREIRGWTVIDVIMDSDHRLIKYEVVSERITQTPGNSVGNRVRYNVRKADWEKFRLHLNYEKGRLEDCMRGDIETAARNLTESIGRAMVPPGRFRCPEIVGKLEVDLRG